MTKRTAAFFRNSFSISGNDATVAMPEAQRIAATAKKIPSNLVSAIANTYGMSSAKLSNMVGGLYLDAMQEGAGANVTSYIVIGILAAVVGAVFAFNYSSANKTLKKCIDRLDAEGVMQQACDELRAYSLMPGNPNNLVLTERFIFDKRASAVVPYADVVWIYRHVTRRNFSTINSFVVCKLNDFSEINFYNRGGSGRGMDLQQIFEAIVGKKPDVLVGYTTDNINAYKLRGGK